MIQIHKRNTRTGFVESIYIHGSKPPKGWHSGANCSKCNKTRSAKALQNEKVKDSDLLHFRTEAK